MDKAPGTEVSAFASKALSRDVGKDCISPVCTAPDGPVFQEGDFLLGTAPLGQVVHYTCARANRKDLIRAIYKEQDERRAKYQKKQQGTQSKQAEKRSRVEATVSFAALAPDSDDELLEESDS
ncbi:expressed unknown protein [Ectocarpus siliculosus]|uniref:Uncharacterized protein n=1 Tax=Ectocarpus siliculosus TaxID=2880 RepID=D8LK07_ECTSI|nr:expressed unknown protein [Ectocarpus siliculosus]|eukprot:CBN74476.1 expressed unknown protein [Ectocarpus siliculosus]